MNAAHTAAAVADHPAEHLAHQFDDPQQQRQAAELGMWLFLVTEVMFFGGLFLAYLVYRLPNEQAFAHASRHLDPLLGGINTLVLLASSLLMALAVHAAEHGRRRWLPILLVGTMLLGGVFLGIKAYEYQHKYHDGLMPRMSAYDKLPGAERIFLNLYFLMTGVHAIHMVIGIGLLAVLSIAAFATQGRAPRATTVHVAGLYWHFVDIVWVFLYPFLYLIAVHR